MATVRAKFVVNKTSQTLGSRNTGKKDEHNRDIYEACPMDTIEASPVYANGDPNHENTKFWQASPGGKFELNCVNPGVLSGLKAGVQFYVDITIAE